MTTATALRRSLTELTEQSSRDLAALWLRIQSAAEADIALRALLPGLIDSYGLAASALAAEWYDSARQVERIPGAFTAMPARVGHTGADELIGWALKTATDDQTFQSLINGGVQRRVANVARETVIDSAVADPAATGWQRVARSAGCGFCQMLAGRGAVYKESTVNFGAHDDCYCMATVAWDDRQLPVEPYTPSAATITDADRARTRTWMRANGLI